MDRHELKSGYSHAQKFGRWSLGYRISAALNTTTSQNTINKKKKNTLNLETSIGRKLTKNSIISLSSKLHLNENILEKNGFYTNLNNQNIFANYTEYKLNYFLILESPLDKSSRKKRRYGPKQSI